MKANTKTLLITGVIVLVVIIGISLIPNQAASTKYDGFAQCIADSGAKFYGAFWCPHCQAEKARFGGSARLLPYIECSTADGKGQLKECTDIGISNYPTWKFADGTEILGEAGFEKLAQKTGCVVPPQ
jgi:hypothetical protein